MYQKKKQQSGFTSMYLAKTYLSGGGGGHKTRLSGQHKIYLKFLDMIF